MVNNKTRDRILAAIKRNPNATIRELVKSSKASSTSVVAYHIHVMLASHILSRGAKWIVHDLATVKH